MKPEEINRAIAESLGWIAHPTCPKVWRTPEQCERNKKLLGTVSGPWSLESSGPPNYCTDLNACAEFEAKLADGEPQDEYLRELQFVTETFEKVDADQDDDWLLNIVTAAAPQRCEAYLRTIGKWRAE